jgi:hypothetical protein
MSRSPSLSYQGLVKLLILDSLDIVVQLIEPDWLSKSPYRAVEEWQDIAPFRSSIRFRPFSHFLVVREPRLYPERASHEEAEEDGWESIVTF